jgi:hypothetical protein
LRRVGGDLHAVAFGVRVPARRVADGSRDPFDAFFGVWPPPNGAVLARNPERGSSVASSASAQRRIHNPFAGTAAVEIGLSFAKISRKWYLVLVPWELPLPSGPPEGLGLSPSGTFLHLIEVRLRFRSSRKDRLFSISPNSLQTDALTLFRRAAPISPTKATDDPKTAFSAHQPLGEGEVDQDVDGVVFSLDRLKETKKTEGHHGRRGREREVDARPLRAGPALKTRAKLAPVPYVAKIDSPQTQPGNERPAAVKPSVDRLFRQK